VTVITSFTKPAIWKLHELKDSNQTYNVTYKFLYFT